MNDNIDQELEEIRREESQKSNATGEDLPGTNQYVLLGVVAIITSFVFIGIVIGGILIRKTREAQEYYQAFPEKFNESSLSKVGAAQIMAIIAVAISLITPLIYLFLKITNLIRLISI